MENLKKKFQLEVKVKPEVKEKINKKRLEEQFKLIEQEITGIRMIMRGENGKRNVDELHEEMGVFKKEMGIFKEEMILWRQNFA